MRLVFGRTPFIWLGVILGLSLAASAGIFSFWTDSEMWPVAATKYFFAGLPEYYFLTKPLFHLLLYPNQVFAQALDIHPMDSARGFMILNTIGIVIATLLILRKMGSTSNAAIATLFLLSISFFVKRSGQVRSDMIVTQLLLWLLYFELLPKKNFTWLIRSTLAGAALLISPKAILGLLCFWPFYKQYFTLKSVRVLIVFAVGLVIFSLVAPNLSRLWMDPGAFFINSFLMSETGISYFDPIRISHLVRLCFENPHLILLFAFFVVMSIKARKRNAKPPSMAWRVQMLSLSMLVYMLIYPDRLPFFITSLLPFFVIGLFSSPHIQSIFSHSGPRGKYSTQLIAGLSFLLALHWALLVLGSHSNRAQRRSAEWIQNEVDKLPPVEIYDPTGVLPHSEAHYWFLGPGQVEKNRYVINYILQRKPEIILFSAKLLAIEPRLFAGLHGQYSGDGSGIFVRKILIMDPPRALETSILKRDLEKEFPRLSGRSDLTWLVRLRDRSGVEINQSLRWDDLNANKKIFLPPNLERVTIQPFTLSLPYGENLTELFRFDAEF